MAKRKETKKYAREALLKSKRYAQYQRDFLAAVLTKSEYTLAEADKAVSAFFGKAEAER